MCTKPSERRRGSGEKELDMCSVPCSVLQRGHQRGQRGRGKCRGSSIICCSAKLFSALEPAVCCGIDNQVCCGSRDRSRARRGCPAAQHAALPAGRSAVSRACHHCSWRRLPTSPTASSPTALWRCAHSAPHHLIDHTDHIKEWSLRGSSARVHHDRGFVTLI